MSNDSSRELGLDELQRTASDATEAYRGSQRDLAEALGLSHSVISRATRKTGMAHAAVQAKIVSFVCRTPVHRRTTYRAHSYGTVEHEWIVEDPDAKDPLLF